MVQECVGGFSSEAFVEWIIHEHPTQRPFQHAG